MAERQYTDEEAAAIFARAAEVDQTGPAVPAQGRGMTLAALQDIGREVGISPESIALAAQSLTTTGQQVQRRFLGIPIGVGRTVELDRPLSDPEWEALVADLRTTFEARGAVRYDGPFRQWTNGNLQALVEPTATGHRLRLRSLKTDARALMAGGAVLSGGAAAFLIAITVAGGHPNPGAGPEAALFALLGLGIFAAGALRVSAWARRRKAQFEEIIARLTRGSRAP